MSAKRETPPHEGEVSCVYLEWEHWYVFRDVV